jgi:molybdenum cofactor biosynthesis protein B
VQSRACGGFAGGTLIFCVPGSPGACQDAWRGILKAQLDNRHRPCSFLEIMPRFKKHAEVEAKA